MANSADASHWALWDTCRPLLAALQQKLRPDLQQAPPLPKQATDAEMTNYGGALVADLLLPFSQMDAMTTLPMLMYTLLAAFVGYVLYEQAIYGLARRHAKGPDSPGFPLLGRIIEMVCSPVAFWDRQREYNPNGVSINFILGRLVVFVTSPQACKKIFTGLEDFALFAHPNAKWLFGRNNLIYLQKNPHKVVRNFLQPALFHKEAFRKYLCAQAKTIHAGISNISTGHVLDVLPHLRKMNAMASQAAFVGPYLTSQGEKEQLAQDLISFTQGFLCFPCPLPFTGLWKAIQAKKRLEGSLKRKVLQSWTQMEQGEEPECALDYIVKSVQTSAGAEINWRTDEIALTLMDFLFAAQDATTSALVWAMTLLDKQPKLMEMIRSEVAECLPQPYNSQDDMESLVSSMIESLHKLTITEKIAIGVLHHRPPVPMVPHLARKKTVIEGFTIPKGALVIPSITSAAENLSTRGILGSDVSDPQFMQNLVFGAGQHKCPGRNYALQTLKVFLAMFSIMCTHKRICSESFSTEQVMYMPTLFPVESKFVVTAR